MSRSGSSRAGRSSDRTENRPKGGNRARIRPMDCGVQGGRVNKQPRRRISDRVEKGVREMEGEDAEDRNEEHLVSENDTDEEDQYEDAGTERDCSEKSGSATEKDTPTRVALERRQESQKEIRGKITSRTLVRPRNPTKRHFSDGRISPSSPGQVQLTLTCCRPPCKHGIVFLFGVQFALRRVSFSCRQTSDV